VDRLSHEARPSATLPEKSTGAPVSVSLRGPFGLGGRTVRISQFEFGKGRCVFENLHYRLSGVFRQTVGGPSVDCSAMVGGQSARVVLIGECCGISN
jgi:hypothetical protein